LRFYLWAATAGLVALAVGLLVPGRIGGHYLRNLFLGRKLFDRHRFDESVGASNAFLADLRRQPWRRHFIYLQYAFYSWDVEAMARNNLGAARMELGNLEQAERDLQDALRRDPDYPLAYFNLGIIAHARGDADEGERLISAASERGYTGGPIDKAIERVAAAYARFQARG
jgi:tetratricopeptide (TPR) repeat protein